jgi:hypothetical protein
MLRMRVLEWGSATCDADGMLAADHVEGDDVPPLDQDLRHYDRHREVDGDKRFLPEETQAVVMNASVPELGYRPAISRCD